MSQWALVLSGSFGTASIWGLVAIVRMVLSRNLNRVIAADRLSDSALELVKAAETSAKEARDEAKNARNEAEQARRDAREARQEATEARREAMDANREFRHLKTEILSPYATVEKLRLIVGDHGSNGTAAMPRF